MSELVLEAGKTYVFKDDECKEGYLSLLSINKNIYRDYYRNGFEIYNVDLDGDGQLVCGNYCITNGEKKYFKLKEEKDMKEFTKDMLIAGKHICETRDGEKYLVMIGDDGLFMSDPSSRCEWMGLDETYSKELLFEGDDQFDIMKIYTSKMTNFYDWSGLNLIWERKELTEQQKKILELEETINKAQEQIKQLKGE